MAGYEDLRGQQKACIFSMPLTKETTKRRLRNIYGNTFVT